MASYLVVVLLLPAFISGLLSITPPGRMAGNCDCAHLTMLMAGLFIRRRETGARQMIWSMMPLGRYALSPKPSPSRSNALLSLQ